jgi:glycosyltransferase involved in cell wall biosynthesis
MKVKLLSFSFTRGGAAIAAEKFSKLAGNLSEVQVYSVEKHQGGIYPNKYQYIIHLIKRILEWLIVIKFQKKSLSKMSTNFFTCNPLFRKFISDSDNPEVIFNVHWFNNSTISIRNIEELPYATVLTLHDEWLFLGVLHSSYINNSISQSSYFLRCLDRFVFGRKLKKIQSRKDLIITCPSSWMKEQAVLSGMFTKDNVLYLPNPIDTSFFKPVMVNDESLEEYDLLGVKKKFVILYCGGDINSKNIKGAHLLVKSIKLLKSLNVDTSKLILITFSDQREDEIGGIKVIGLGKQPQKKMPYIYSLSNITIVPSLSESFGQVAAESLSCETPVVSFNCTGLKDIVTDGMTGFLADAYSYTSLALCIKTAVAKDYDHSLKIMGEKGRVYIEGKFSSDVVQEQYNKILLHSFNLRENNFNHLRH